MHDALKAFFDLHDEKTRHHCQCAKSQGAQVVGIAGAIEGHLVALETQIQIAEDTADPDDALQNNTNQMHRQIEMVRARSAAFRAAWRELSQALTALPGGLDVGKTNVLNVLRERGKVAPSSKSDSPNTGLA